MIVLRFQMIGEEDAKLEYIIENQPIDRERTLGAGEVSYIEEINEEAAAMINGWLCREDSAPIHISQIIPLIGEKNVEVTVRGQQVTEPVFNQQGV